MDVHPNPYAQIPDRQDAFMLDRPFVLTQDKTLIPGMPYMYSEGNRRTAVRLLKVWTEDNIIYLRVEEIQSPKTFCLSLNLYYSGNYFLWTLADLPTIMTLTK